MRSLILAAVLLTPSLFIACNSGSAPDQADTDSGADVDTGTDWDDDSGSIADQALRCESTGVFDFRTVGVGFDKYDGHIVWAAAVQPINSPHTDTVTVLLETTIESGEFETSCQDSLEENYRYPSYAVVIDADESGDCSPEDYAAVGQFYAWNEDQEFTTEAFDGTDQAQGIPIGFVKIGDTTTWGERAFCDYYVPSELLK